MDTLRIAALRPLNLLVLAAALVGGLTAAIWLLPLGLLAYAAAVVLAARDPALTAPPAPALPRITSPAFRAVIAEIDRSQREVERSVRAAQGPLAGVLGAIVTQTQDLVAEAHALAAKGQLIEASLQGNNIGQIQSQIARVDQQIAVTSDPFTRQQLEETRGALLNRQRNSHDLQTYIGRINAQLANIDASLDNVLVETVRLRAADAVAASSLGGAVNDRLRDLKSDMDAFQKALDSAMTGI